METIHQDTSQNNTKSRLNRPEQRARRKTWREISAAYDALLRAAGFTPAERRAITAIEQCLYEIDGQPPDTPRPVALALIGAALTSKSDELKARTDRAREACGHLFIHAIPRTGYQVLTRYKAEEESGRPHEYASHGAAVAELVADLWAEERAKILAVKGQRGKAAKIAESLERLADEALSLLPRCEVEIVAPHGEVYARVSAPEAKAYCARNPEFSSRAFSYTPPASPEEEKRKKPFFDQDLKRIETKIKAEIESYLDEIAARNSFDEARLFSTRIIPAIHKLLASWAKVSALQAEGEVERREELIHGGETGGVPLSDAAETGPVPPPEPGGVSLDNLAEFNDLQTPIFESAENQSSGSVNFDSAAVAADFYIRDGFPVVPCCQFDPATGLCTGPESHQEDGPCRGKRPLIKGRKDAKPGDGYTAASRDRGRARDWFTRQFPDAGVAIRLDGHILIDCDVKDGARGLESYQILADTFDLPETLTATTPSGGRHYIFKLPDDLPPDFLGSWTRVADKAELGGIDLKVGAKGLAHVEPTRGAKDVYRWIDPTFPPATLSREVCEYLHNLHAKDAQAQAANAQASASSEAQPFDPAEDQAKYFKQVAVGDRHPRLLKIARKVRARGADADQIKKVLNYHALRFAQPLDDQPWIDRVAAECVTKFQPEVNV